MIRIFLLVFWITLSVSAQNTGKGEVTYLDSNDNPTTKNNATYYEFRTELKPGIWKYQKYFIDKNNSKAFLVEKYYYDSDKKKQGKYTAYYDNGFIQKEGIYLNDLKSGQWRNYFKSIDSLNNNPSKLLRVQMFKNDTLNGLFKDYYIGGNLKAEGTYKNGFHYYGNCKWYHENGHLASEENYDESGKLISIKMWNEKGEEIEAETEILGSFRPLQKDILKYVNTHFNKNIFKLNNFGKGKIIVGLEFTDKGELNILNVQRVGFVPEAFEKEVRKWILKYAEKDLEPVKFHNLPIQALFKVSFSFKGKY